MRPPSAPELLDLWERGRTAEPAARAVLLLAAAEPDGGPPALSGLTVGERNRRLLALRALLFGPVVDAVTECPACGELLEVEFGGPPEPRHDDSAGEGEVRSGAWSVRFRLPTAGDLVGLPAGAEDGVRALLARCVLTARRAGGAATPADLPPEVVGELDAAIAAADPDGAVDVAVGCRNCGHNFLAALEPVAFLWAQLERWGWQQLAEVHDLARLFGWDEDAVLALSPWRRRAYLALAAS